MASKKDDSKAKDKVKWQGYVNVYLNRTEKQHIKDHPLDAERAVQFIQDAAEAGYKVSTSYSESGGFYTVTLYGNESGGLNAGWAMSLRHSDFLVALSALHHVADEDGLKSDWGERFGAGEGNDW